MLVRLALGVVLAMSALTVAVRAGEEEAKPAPSPSEQWMKIASEQTGHLALAAAISQETRQFQLELKAMLAKHRAILGDKDAAKKSIEQVVGQLGKLDDVYMADAVRWACAEALAATGEYEQALALAGAISDETRFAAMAEVARFVRTTGPNEKYTAMVDAIRSGVRTKCDEDEYASWIWFEVGILLAEAGDGEGAIKVAGEPTASAEDKAATYGRVSAMLRENGDKARAETALKAAKEAMSQFELERKADAEIAEYRWTDSQMIAGLAAAGEFDEARKLYAKITEGNEIVEGAALFARYLHAKDPGAAKKLYEEAFAATKKIDSEFPDGMHWAALTLGQSMAHTGELDLAKKLNDGVSNATVKAFVSLGVTAELAEREMAKKTPAIQ